MTPIDDEICSMDAVSLAMRIRSKELSPVEVVEAVLRRIERLDPLLHAFCTPTPEVARADATRIESELVAGRAPGPLAGVPVGIKDLVFTKGVRTTGGSAAYLEFIPDEDDIVVERLKAAGAIIIGKTNVAEFGYGGFGHNSVFETTRNPWNMNLTSGGSSAGSAAAVATGMGPFAIGTDGGGSIRVPCSFCGLFGMKPSMGRVPLYPGARDERYPGLSSFESVEHIGPMSRTVADGALMLSVIAGPDDRDRHSLPRPDFDWVVSCEGDLRGLRVAYSIDFGYAAVDREVKAAFGSAVEVFERDLGCLVEEKDPGWADPHETFWATVIADTDLSGLLNLADTVGEQMMPHLVETLRSNWSADDLTRASTARKAMYNRMWKFMREYDLLLTPTVAVPPFPVGLVGPEQINGHESDPRNWTPFTFPFNLTGQPAATVPAGWTKDGLPVGLQIVGRHLDDSLVLRASAAFEAVAPWRHRWPPAVENLGRAS